MKNGFTLIELLGVVAVLAIIGTISVPIITNIINTNADNIDKAQEQLIISGAKSYALSKGFNVPNCVDVSTLKSEGYLENDNTIKSARTEVSYEDYSVKIEPNGGSFKYTLQKNKC